MSFRANSGELSKRVLDADTARFPCEVYPAGKPTKTCFPKQVSSELGKAARGCQAAPGGLLLVAAALFLSRRRAA